jgi:hypothetical protein
MPFLDEDLAELHMRAQGTMTRPCALLLSLFVGLGCAAARTPDQLALMKKADCRELLLAADAARAQLDQRLAHDLAAACPQAGLEGLVEGAGTPAEAFLWCGRARAALVDRATTPSCKAEKIVELTSELRPRLTLGPAEPSAPPDPVLQAALDEIGPRLNLAYDHDNPVVFVGEVRVSVDRSESQTIARVPDADGKRHQLPATLHRVLARAEVQVELGTRTRTIHAAEEARDTTWEGEPRLSIAAHFDPQIAPEAELRRRAVVALLRNMARALRASPPEGLQTSDTQGCLAYGVALAVATGNRIAAASGVGDPLKLAACEQILGMPAGAGIPIP